MEHHKPLRRLVILCVVSMVSLLASAERAGADDDVRFESARPIWPDGRETEKNLFVGFRTAFERPDGGHPVLRITASSLYRVYLNGRFVGHGPARGPHGYFRVDEWPLPCRPTGRNVLAIEVAGYNVNSYYLLDQPAFLQAEVISNGKVLASTGGQGADFEAAILKHRVQKVQRYSFQRPFIEYYRLAEGDDRWWDKPSQATNRVSCSTLPSRKLLVRRVAYPRFLKRQPSAIVSRGTLQREVPVTRLWKDRSLVNIGPKLKGYTESELEVVPSTELQRIRSASREKLDQPYQPDQAIELSKNAFAILDLGTNLTGFIGAEIRCPEQTVVYITFDEVLAKDDVDFKRLGCVNAVCYDLAPGTYALESFEPYTMRYLKLNVLQGHCNVRNVYLRECTNPETDEAQFACSDPRLNRVFEAARETFRQNATDIFMDCP